jgi:aspartate oxidase
MADDTKKQPAAPPGIQQPVSAANVAPSPSSSDTVPGGRYIVGGVAVDSEGKPLAEQPAEKEG